MAVVFGNTLGGQGTGLSKMERWWLSQGFQKIYKEFRTVKLEDKLQKQITDVREIQKVFKLKGYQFGNWVTNEDRFNYLAATGICLFDLNRVLKFKDNNLGLDKNLGIAFGARGRKGALAHYEPSTNIINITRYKDADRFIKPLSKEVRFVNSGGVGAFAHEYGHLLDYFFGSRVEVNSRYYSLSNGSSTNRTRIPYDKKKYPMRTLVEDILEKSYWKNPKTKEESNFYKRIRKFSENDYFVERTEIIARLFEQYIGYKLKQLKIQNKFLTQTKYAANIYMSEQELKQIVPLFDKLLTQMRKQF